MEVYLDAKCTHQQSDTTTSSQLTPSGMVFDGVYSIGGEIFLFGDGSPSTQEGIYLQTLMNINMNIRNSNLPIF